MEACGQSQGCWVQHLCRNRFRSRPGAPREYLVTVLLLRWKLKALLRKWWVCVFLTLDLSTHMGACVVCRLILAAFFLWCFSLALLL